MPLFIGITVTVEALLSMSIIPVWNLFRLEGCCRGCQRKISGVEFPNRATGELAEIFHRLKLIESYGTGIRKIFALYKGCAVQPKIDVTQNTFKMILPNRNADMPEQEALTVAAEKPSTEITSQMKIVLDYLAEYQEMTEEELQELLNIEKTRAYLLARQIE